MTKPNYAPILKWRAAEITALKNVEDKDKQMILPIIELVMPSTAVYKKDPLTKQLVKKTDAEMYDEIINKFESKRVTEIPDELEDTWGTNELILDFSLLYGKNTIQLKTESIKKILPICFSKGLVISPIINLSDDQLILDEVFNQLSQKNIESVCVRITAYDLGNIVELNSKLMTLISERKISETQVHLLVDLKYLSEETSTLYKTLFIAGQSVSNITKWKTFIFASGSFPVDMSKFDVEDNPSILPRNDWLSWCANTKAKGITRVPLFSDYTIRNPIYNESLQFYTSTASLKYTAGDDWLIFKGERGRNDQYLAHAYLLVNSTGKFYGEDYSFGDKYILAKAKHLAAYSEDNKVKGMGKTENWISASVSHHLTLVLSQLASLS